MQFTEEQRRAIEARGTNLLLSAAAGSGKTAVLVQRVLSLIEEGADVRRMLVVTFTRAAAAEMRPDLRITFSVYAVSRISMRENASSSLSTTVCMGVPARSALAASATG